MPADRRRPLPDPGEEIVDTHFRDRKVQAKCLSKEEREEREKRKKGEREGSLQGR